MTTPIEIEPADRLKLFHGTVQPLGQTIESFRLSRAIPMPTAKSAQYNNPGEAVKALTEIDAVWMATEPEIAEQYMTPRWGAATGSSDQGQLYETELSADRVAYVPYTDEEAVREAMLSQPQVIVLEDRREALVLDPALIKITNVTDEMGEQLEGYESLRSHATEARVNAEGLEFGAEPTFATATQPQPAEAAPQVTIEEFESRLRNMGLFTEDVIAQMVARKVQEDSSGSPQTAQTATSAPSAKQTIASRLKATKSGSKSRAPSEKAISSARRGRTEHAPASKRRTNAPDTVRGPNPERRFVIQKA